MRPAETNHPCKARSEKRFSRVIESELTYVITGTSKKNKLRQCFTMYAFGSLTPTAKTPIARTNRVNSRVMMLVTSSEPPQARGLKMFAQYGPKKPRFSKIKEENGLETYR